MDDQGVALLVVLTTGCVIGLVTGFLLSFYHGYFGYKVERKKQKDCVHGNYIRKHDYTEVIYDSDLSSRRIVEAYKCVHCGEVKYKQWEEVCE